METRNELSTTCNPNKSYVNMPGSRGYIPTSLPPERPSILYYLKALDIKIAITLELLGQFIIFLDQNDRHSLTVLLIYCSKQLDLKIGKSS